MTDHKKSLENTKGMSGNSTDVMSEGDLAQEKVSKHRHTDSPTVQYTMSGVYGTLRNLSGVFE